MFSCFICMLILRQLPVASPASRPLGQTRRRLNVLGYFFGLFGMFLTAELHSLRLPIPGLLLACLGIASLALFIFLGAQLFSRNNQNTDLGALWTGSRRIFDERELRLRQEVFAKTCRILIVAILGAGFLFSMVDLYELMPVTQGASSLLPELLLYLGLAAAALPTAILTWKEADASLLETDG